jgi:hypothetical protein
MVGGQLLLWWPRHGSRKIEWIVDRWSPPLNSRHNHILCYVRSDVERSPRMARAGSSINISEASDGRNRQEYVMCTRGVYRRLYQGCLALSRSYLADIFPDWAHSHAHRQTDQVNNGHAHMHKTDSRIAPTKNEALYRIGDPVKSWITCGHWVRGEAKRLETRSNPPRAGIRTSSLIHRKSYLRATEGEIRHGCR